MKMQPAHRHGFTLIELSIVLVIIGLIVGGVLVGQDLIRAATARAQITQIEKYNQAVNAFRTKYNNYLPGDIPAVDASNFGLIARGPYEGEGDGNGVLEGNYNNTSGGYGGNYVARGETGTFWVDLSQAHLIDQTFNTATEVSIAGGTITATTSPNIASFFPAAAIGNGNYVYVWSVPAGPSGTPGNVFGICSITDINSVTTSAINTVPTITVSAAYSIDKKVDDGLPQSGNVLALYSGGASLPTGGSWANGSHNWAGFALYNAATAGSATSCFDNGNVTSATQQYSVEINNGAGANCALSFRFQ